MSSVDQSETPSFKVGDRVRYVPEDGFAGKIVDRCWMSGTNPWRLAPDGVVVKTTHVPEGEERYLGWEFATRPADLEHID
ncbi:hypothetical protein SEA_ECLIPTUS_48 [Gordonia phage Ecliptus]|nr:hypothetical protein SEA_ECLIPTUS_48 [Gordonia phage Ecliptus]